MNDKIIGRNPVLEAIRSGRSVDKILVKKGKYEGSIVPIIKKAKDAGIIIQEVERAKLDQIAEGENHQGVIAYVSAYDYVSVKDILDKAREKNEPPFFINFDKITDPNIVSVHTVLLFRKEIQLVLTVLSQKLRQVRLNIHLLQRLQISLTRLTA